MLESVKNTIKRYNMLKDATEVTVALSGGADSVALLLCLAELKEELGIKLYAAHMNHCLRGEESDSDEQFVRDLCEKVGVELFYGRVDVKAEAEKTHESTELCARRLRYDFLEKVSKGLIATAHTANDNLETVLFNIARGTGLKGLCGIPPVRGRIIRPFISVTREQVEAYCNLKETRFCVDSTNFDEKYARNLIRHSVVPKLKEINSGAVGNAALMSTSLREDMQYLEAAAEQALKSAWQDGGMNVQRLMAMYPAIRSRCIASAYEKVVGRVPEHRHITAIAELLEDGGKASVQGDWYAVVKNGVLSFLPPKADEKLSEILIETIPFENEALEIIEVLVKKDNSFDKFNNLFLNNAIDCAKICGKLTLRGRIDGEKIRLRKRNCTKSLKKLFNEYKIDEQLRDSVPILADSEGLVWVGGFGVAERCAVTEDTQKLLAVSVKPHKK